MKVAYITMQFPVPSETFATNDVRALTRLGINISVFGLRRAHPNEEKLVLERDVSNIKLSHRKPAQIVERLARMFERPRQAFSLLSWVVRLHFNHPEHLLKSLFLAPRALEIFAELEALTPDVVHIYWGHYPSMVGFLVKRFKSEIPVTISLVAYDLEMGYEGSRWLVERAEGVRTLAKVNSSIISVRYNIDRDSVTIIHDGVDIERFNSVPNPKIPKRVLSVGRLVKDKGMDEVIKIFAAVYEQHPDATLVILGDGDERLSLEEQCKELGISDVVTFGGHVKHDRVFQEMLDAELFLFMSAKKDERLPNVVKEAMLAGCICITTDTVGIEELIKDENYGFVVPKHDVKGAMSTVLTVFDESFDRQPLQSNSKAYIEENFNLKCSAKQYIDFWEQALKRNRSKTQAPHR